MFVNYPQMPTGQLPSKELFEKFEAACRETDGVEYWSAREIQILFNYKEWRNFLNTIEKAKKACINDNGGPQGPPRQGRQPG